MSANLRARAPLAKTERETCLFQTASSLAAGARDFRAEALLALLAGNLDAPQDAEFRGDLDAFSRRLHHLLALAGTRRKSLADLFGPGALLTDARMLAEQALAMLVPVLSAEHGGAALTERDRRFFEAGEMVGRWDRAEAAKGGVLQPRKKRAGRAKGNANSTTTNKTKAGARAEEFFPFYDRKDAALSRNARIIHALKDMAAAGLSTRDPETCRRWLIKRSSRG